MNKEVVDIKLGGEDKEEERKSFQLEKLFEGNKLTIGLLLAGIILIGAGILGFKIVDLNTDNPKVEILGTAEVGGEKWETGTGDGKTEVGKITVEAAGEVIKPSVYEMKAGSRINDLLLTAGGMSAEADREWVAKYINLAQKLQDGVKIYISRKGGEREVGNGSGMGSGSEVNVTLININIASEAELDTLWGVGPVTAKKIIDGRPYQRPEELLEKKIVKSNVWEEIKDKVSVY